MAENNHFFTIPLKNSDSSVILQHLLGATASILTEDAADGNLDIHVDVEYHAGQKDPPSPTGRLSLSRLSPVSRRRIPMTILVAVLATLALFLFILNIYQFLTQRAALRIADILYIMSRNVREKAAEVRRDRKDVEIVEAHLFDISTSARSLLRTLGRSEDAIGPDPTVDLSPNGSSRLDNDSLLRLADNILYAVSEDNPTANWDSVVTQALERFMLKAPMLDREGAKKIVTAVARQSDRDTNGPVTFSVSEQN